MTDEQAKTPAKATLADMAGRSQIVIPDEPKRCGNCEYAKRLDLNTVQCFGSPPTPVLVGGSQGPLGRVNLNIEPMRPNLSVNERACALWALSPVNSLLNLPGMAKA